VSIEFALCRTTPKGILCICSACRRTGTEYVCLMLNHKQSASCGLIWCPQCYEGRKGRKFHSGHLGECPRAKKGGAPLPLQKPSVSASSSGSLSSTTCTGTTFESFPTLWAFLVLGQWPDGTARKVGTMILFTEGDKWKACLKDPNGSRVAFVTGRDLDSLLLSIDAGLDSEGLDWRPDRPQGGQGRKLS